MKALVTALTIFGFVAILPANPADSFPESAVAYETGTYSEDSSPRASEPAEEEDEDLPWVPILVLSLSIPAAALLIPSFFGKPGSGGH